MSKSLDTLIKVRDSLLLQISALESEIASALQLPPISTQTTTDELPSKCIPIRANVLDFDFSALASRLQFDVIMMDPPWQLATNACTRGVHISYASLTDAEISALPLPTLQSQGGFLFIWTINQKYAKAIEMFCEWGYRLVDEIVWVKSTVNRRLAKGHGYYLQHAKETCLVGYKQRVGNSLSHFGVAEDVLFAERRGQSQKPVEIYELIEKLVPGGRYLEIFGRRNNLRDCWVTIGNEL
jgi:mRNA (2'-O-methyladenosine-N6-)-methyltransferase